MPVEGLSTSVRPADIDAEFTAVVVKAVVIDAQEELSVSWHLDADAAADRERLAVRAVRPIRAPASAGSGAFVALRPDFEPTGLPSFASPLNCTSPLALKLRSSLRHAGRHPCRRDRDPVSRCGSEIRVGGTRSEARPARWMDAPG